MNFNKLLLALTLVFSTIFYSQSGTPSYSSVWSNMVQSASTGTTTWNLVAPNPILPTLVAKGTEYWTLHTHKMVLPNYTLPKSQGNPDRIMFIDGTSGEVKVSDSNPFDIRYKGILYTPNSSEVLTALGYTPYNSSNPANYITANSSNVLTNKSGNISQWINDSGYLTTVPAQPWLSITGKPNFSTVSISGDYNDLVNKPTLFSGVYSDLTGKPSLFSGDYNDLINKPFIPLSQVQTDWNATTGLGVLLNKPSLSTVATSGFYNDLNGKPTTLYGYGITDAYPLIGNPSGFLTGITSTQVTIALGYTPYNGTINPNNYITSSGLISTLSAYVTSTSLGTTLSNYVTNSVLSNTLGSYATSSSVTSGLTTKQDLLISGSNIKTVSGQSVLGLGNITLNKSDIDLSNVDNTSDSNKPISIATQTALNSKYDSSNPSNYINQSGARSSISLTNTGSGIATYNSTTGVLNIPTPTTVKRQLTYSGTTDASGNYTVVFGTPFSVAPNIQQNLIGGNALQGTLVTNISTTGFTIQAYTRSTVSSLPVIGTLTGLLVGVATNPLVGGNIDVLITEK